MRDTYLDIETVPQQPEKEAKAIIAETIQPPATMSKPETISDWHNGVGKYANAKSDLIEIEYRKTSFDASKGQICSISWAVEDGEIHNTRCDEISERDMLRFFFDKLLIEIDGKDPFFIGHYIAGFDLRFIWQRAVINDVRPPFRLPFKGRHSQDFFCTQIEWCGFKDRISMDNLCKALRIEGKGDMDGSKVWDAWKEKRFDDVSNYNNLDVDKVRKIHKRLIFGR